MGKRSRYSAGRRWEAARGPEAKAVAGSRCPAASFPSPPGAAQNDTGAACRAEGEGEGRRGPSFTEKSLGGSGPRDERGTVRRG